MENTEPSSLRRRLSARLRPETAHEHARQFSRPDCDRISKSDPSDRAGYCRKTRGRRRSALRAPRRAGRAAQLDSRGACSDDDASVAAQLGAARGTALGADVARQAVGTLPQARDERDAAQRVVAAARRLQRRRTSRRSTASRRRRSTPRSRPAPSGACSGPRPRRRPSGGSASSTSAPASRAATATPRASSTSSPRRRRRRAPGPPGGAAAQGASVRALPYPRRGSSRASPPSTRTSPRARTSSPGSARAATPSSRRSGS